MKLLHLKLAAVGPNPPLYRHHHCSSVKAQGDTLVTFDATGEYLTTIWPSEWTLESIDLEEKADETR